MDEELKYKLDEFKNMEDMLFYYHFTDSDCESIIYDGLYMVDKYIYKTANDLPNEFWDDPIEFTKNLHGNFYRKNLVIIGVDENKKDDFIYETSMIPDEWTLDEPPNYYIPSNYIAGYVDYDNEEIIWNNNFETTKGLLY